MMTVYEVRQMLMSQVDEAGSQSAWARLHGINTGYVSDVIKNRREPGPKVLKALGLRRLERITMYEPEAVE